MRKLDPDVLEYLKWQMRRHNGFEAYRAKKVKEKKIKTRPIYRGEERKHKIQEVMHVLRDWRLSPFEFEGACRNGLRAALCDQGFSWERSNDEATSLVNAAITFLGYQRPTWDQGQREYVVPREECSWCGGVVPSDLMTGKDRQYGFCSEICARAAVQERNWITIRRESKGYLDAWDVIQRVNSEKRCCDHCGIEYRGLFGRGRFCSLACSSESQRTVPVRYCKACRKEFYPRTNSPLKGHYCSLKCRSSGGFTTQYERICAWCHMSFIGKVPTARCCGQSCAVAYSGVKSGKKIPKRISPPVFDYYFIKVAA